MGLVVVLGSLNVDLVAAVERHPGPGETVLADGPLHRLAGGKGGNQAVAAAAAGAEVRFLGAVGSDDAGQAYLHRLRSLGIDVSGVRVVDGSPTGQAWITVDEHGENSIVVIPGANAYVTADDPARDPADDPADDFADHLAGQLAELGQGDVLLLQLEVPLRTVAAAARAAHGRGARVVLNAAPYAALPRDVVALADPLVVNEHEALQLADSDAAPASLLVTFGAAGCSWDGERSPGIPVDAADVLDTTGAGDAFCGALAAALAAGATRHDAVRAASEAGAAAVRHRGAQPDPDL
ncbi:ribokinase [Phycicoccus badiiscoriae]|uniref:Ribokinase n=1 Tax=Pedococcus badiiscoriae TaxID=642776 RepID=A0A852WE14_9MICO|nr:PfkB family carbohydrate kinase [Pedococcus badiiscoriae]NYG07453.1 ribokinase [Pedococcus badiiscoriae]